MGQTDYGLAKLMTAFTFLCSDDHNNNNDNNDDDDDNNKHDNDNDNESSNDDDDGDEQSYSLDDDFEDQGSAPDLPGNALPPARNLGSPYVANGSGSGGGGEKVRFRDNEGTAQILFFSSNTAITAFFASSHRCIVMVRTESVAEKKLLLLRVEPTSRLHALGAVSSGHVTARYVPPPHPPVLPPLV